MYFKANELDIRSSRNALILHNLKSKFSVLLLKHPNLIVTIK